MVKINPETAAARAKSDEDQLCADTGRFPGTLPRSIAAFAAGLGGNLAAPLQNVSPRDTDGDSLCSSERTSRKMRNVDFGDAIGKELQNLYDDLVAQPVPDRFLNLLNQLEKNMVSSGVSSRAPGERE